MKKNIIIMPLLACFLAVAAFANEALIKEHLQKLEQASSIKLNGVKAGFQLKPNFLQIDLFKPDCKLEGNVFCPVVKVGKIEMTIEDSARALQEIAELEKIGGSSNVKDFAEERNNLNEFKSKIKSGNTARINWVKIKENFRAKKLSYPLICKALEILKNVYRNEYVFLDDHSLKPGYYNALGFVDVGKNSSGKHMFGSIAKILQSQKCIDSKKEF